MSATTIKKIRILVCVILLTHTNFGFSQFDDDFDSPPIDGGFAPPSYPTQTPPTAPMPSNPNLGSGSNSGSTQGRDLTKSKSTPTKETGPIGKNQKQKFADAGIEDITNENFPEIIESFDFPNAEISDIVKAISELTGKNFIIDPGVRGKITIMAPTKITVAEAYKAFLSALAINGFAVVPSGKFYKIRNSRAAQRDNIETFSGAYYPDSDQMITKIVHLRHISVDNVQRDLRLLTSKDGEMATYQQTNSLIISDYGANIDRIMKILNQLDVPGFDDQIEVIPVKYAKAKDIADLIDKILNKGEKRNNNVQGGFSAGVPRFGAGRNGGAQGSAYYLVIPDDRTNALIVTGNKAGIDRIKKLLTQLDFRINPDDAGGVFVYYVKNGEAKKIAETLSGIAKDAGPKQGSAAPQIPQISPITGVQTAPNEIFGGDVKIKADEGTNSLVIVASKQDYEVVLNLLSKIDIPKDQVYVEAIIMEMKATDSQNYQIGYFKFDSSGAKSGFNSFQGSDLTSLLNPAAGSGTILGFGSGDKVTITNPSGGSTTTINSLIGFVNWLKSNTNANVLSTPQIIAMDHEEATISVGDKVVTSFTTVANSGGGSTQNPTMEDATIKLKIKPFISPTTNAIRLELESNIKQLSTAKTPSGFQNTTQPLAIRDIKTQINIQNGDTAVLGGLMKDDEIEQISKVPLLGDIPILGWLFKSRSVAKEKTNMMVFLTPKIIRSQDDTRKLLSQKMDQRLEFIKSIGGRDPYGKAADEIMNSTKSAKDQNTVEPLDGAKQ